MKITLYPKYLIRRMFAKGKSSFFIEGYKCLYPECTRHGMTPWQHYVVDGLRKGFDDGNNPPDTMFFREGYEAEYPDVVADGIDPWHHYVLHGKKEGRDNGLHPKDEQFFAEGYLEMYPDAAGSRLDPWHHYILHGKKEGLDNGNHPSDTMFFREGYESEYPDIKGSCSDPWRHYVLHGKKEGRDNGLHPGEDQFFPEGYLEMFPDAAVSGQDPWHHYVLIGQKEGRDNGNHPTEALFFREGYEAEYPDVKESSLDPWYHYVMLGKGEGRDNGSHPSQEQFFPEGYLEMYADVSYSGEDPWHHYVLKGLKEGRDNGNHPSDTMFFRAGYEEEYQDVKSSGVDPWRHYVLYGKSEGRDNGNHPSEELFGAEGYLEMYPDVAESGSAPWRHYLIDGKKEGRDNGCHPNGEQFFAAGYLLMYQDVAESGLNPWCHYVKFGKKEGRDNGLHPPADLFFAEGYLEINPDVAAIGADPWRHYVSSGRNEGRDNGLHPDEQLFFAEGYKFNYPSCADEPYSSELWKNFLLIGKKLNRNNGLTPLAPFFSGCYLEQHPGITDAQAWKLYVLDSLKRPGQILLPYPPESGMSEILKKKNPSVAVVMPVYNRKNIVMRAIESVQQQSWRNWHLYVVDDFSDDGTFDYLLSVISDSRITLLKSKSKGVCGARNTAISEIKKEEYVAYLDSDNTWNSEYLEQMLCRLLETNTSCCYGALKLLRRKNGGSDEILRFWYDEFDVKELRYANYIDINVFMHRADVFKEIGAFDESLRRMVDWDLILRCAEKYSFSRLPYVGCDYDATEDESRITQTNSFTFRYQNVVRNKYWFDWDFIQRNSKKNDESLVSVIIYYGKSDSVSLLENCLNSLKNARMCSRSKYRTEIILVDDSHSEEISSTVSQYYKESLIDQYLANRFESRFPLSCNRALSVANGSFVVYLAAQSYVSIGWLDALIDPLKRHSRLMGTTAMILQSSGDLVSTGCLFDSVSGLPYDLLHCCPLFLPAAHSLTVLPSVNSICCSFRMSDVIARGGLYCIYESRLAIADLCLQLAAGEQRFAYIPSSYVTYSQSEEQFSALKNDLEAFLVRWYGKNVFDEQKFFIRKKLSGLIKYRKKVCSIDFKEYTETASIKHSTDYLIPVYDFQKSDIATEISEQGTRDKGQGTRDKGQGTRDKGQGTRDKEYVSELEDNPILSVIIPVYNAEKYIGCCIDSILHRQNLAYSILEIICIDDCSSDSTPKILEEYRKVDRRLRIVRLKEHSGAGAARNIGMSRARGKFVHFVDADDLVTDNSYSAWIDTLEQTGADFSCARYKRIDFITNRELDIGCCAFNEKVHVLDISADKSLLIRESVAPWNKMYKKSFILQNNLRFDETMVRNDRSFYLSSVIKAHKVAFYAGCVYGHFVNRTGSLVFQSARYFEDVVTVFKNVFQLCKDCENNTFSDIMDVQFRDLFFWCKKCAGTEYESKALNDVKNFLDVFCMKNMIIERCKPTTVKMIREFESQNSNVKI